uniref:Uncharacterized protein n=1 Tax=Panagrolaimus sp. JU765 TaxID=591449 RepID=A0AC34QPE4_9BILA
MDSFVASEKEEKLLKILNGFVDCFESRDPDTGLSPESQKKCRRFYDVAGRRDGHNYRRIFSLLIKKAETQANGSLFVLKTLTAFFDMIKLLEIDEIHKLYILNYCWNLFDDNILDTV